MIASNPPTLWLPPAKTLVNPFAWMTRIRRGDARIRGANGGRTREQSCCCALEDCDTCLALVDADSTLEVTLADFADATCDCDGTLAIECLQSNLNNAYALDYVSPDTFEIALGTFEDFGDPGVLLRRVSNSGTPTGLCYAWLITGTVSCGTCREAEDGMIAGITISTHGFSGDGGVTNSSYCADTSCSIGAALCKCCPSGHAVPSFADPCKEAPMSCGTIDMSANDYTTCSADTWHPYTPTVEAVLFI